MRDIGFNIDISDNVIRAILTNVKGSGLKAPGGKGFLDKSTGWKIYIFSKGVNKITSSSREPEKILALPDILREAIL